MRPYRRFFNRILAFFGIKRRMRPEDIPHILPSEALARVMEEARLLKQAYQVDVQELQPGEEAGPPTPAGGITIPENK